MEHKKVQMELAIKRKKLMKEFDRLTRPKSVKESYDEFVLMNLEYVCRSRPISSDPKHWN
ncbi:MAG: hypothetical protein KGH64_06150 [Candidatus Micrarchaeota archaeon]|nr:hypothetical protein [Candidatus Micrarchaeota archaeon]